MAAAIPQRLGKFEVRRRLGSGGQAAVYLAHDPDLRRDVAIKLLKPGTLGADAIRREARTVSQLRHPNIVPIHEMGEHQDRIYLVFEYVAGNTLQEELAKNGAIAPRRAAELLLGILDALAVAHEKGVIHRDLKPSNILLDGAGQPHVMDFGIATPPVSGSGLEPDFCGSPAYMAPEYIKGRTVSQQYDVFSAGLILHEMLFGARAVQGDNPFQAMHQIANMPLTFPEGAQEKVGPQLVDVIVKATAKEPELRYASVRQMQEALAAYLQPAGTVGAAQPGSTLEFLMRRMKLKGDFPAMSSAMMAIQRLAASNQSDVGSLASSILKDYALTNKILRLVNSAFYATRTGERIRTVTRAIVMMGFDAVRSIAISLTLFDRIRDKQHAAALKEEFMRANLAGILARELSARLAPAQGEEAFICGMFHNLGRLLTQYYFWEESEAIRQLVAQKTPEAGAALRVLGITYADLGVAVAESWGFPRSITQSMRSFADGKVPRAANADGQLHQVAALANEACAILERTEPAVRADALAELGRRYGESLPLGRRDFEQVVTRSVSSIKELADVLNVNLQQTTLARVVGAPETTAVAASPAPAAPALVEAEVGDGRTAESILTAGIQDISRAQIEDLPVEDLLRIVAETILRALDVRRVVICRRDPRSGAMQPCLGLGADADAVTRRFAFPLGGKDLFCTILQQDSGVLIGDAREPRIRDRLPPWYVTHVDAPTFIVFPMNIRKQTVAMIYADKDAAGSLRVAGPALALVHTLRNQALLALK